MPEAVRPSAASNAVTLRVKSSTVRAPASTARKVRPVRIAPSKLSPTFLLLSIVRFCAWTPRSFDFSFAVATRFSPATMDSKAVVEAFSPLPAAAARSAAPF